MPRIYAACLASYNSGRLHGAWIDCDQDPEDIQAEITAMLAASPTPLAEEYAIHDYEGFEGIKIGEWEDLATLALHARMIEAHGAAWAIYAGNLGTEEPTEDGFTECYQGAHDSREAFAESLTDSGDMFAGIPDQIVQYFDWQSYARDLFMGGDFWDERHNGVIHVFSNV